MSIIQVMTLAPVASHDIADPDCFTCGVMACDDVGQHQRFTGRVERVGVEDAAGITNPRQRADPATRKATFRPAVIFFPVPANNPADTA